MKAMQIHRSPDAGEGGGGAAPSAPAETAQAAEPASAEPDWAKIRSDDLSGVEVPQEHLEAYMQKLSDGYFDNPQTQPEQAPLEEASAGKPGGESEAVRAVMAEVGAKTPEEAAAKARELRNLFSQASGKAKQAEQAAQNQAALINDLIAGDPKALAFIKQQTGKEFPAPAAAQAPGADPFADYLLSEDEIEMSVDPSLGKAFNGRLRALLQSHSQEVQALRAELDGFKEAKNGFEEQKRYAQFKENQSIVIDRIAALADRYPDDYGLKGLPVKTLLERFFADPSNPPPELAELLETAKVFETRPGTSWDEAHAIRYYAKMNGKVAQAKMGAAQASPKPPTVGVAGTGAMPSNPSEAQMEAMAAGTMDIPEAYLDEDGLPVKGRCPQKLYALLTGAA